MIHVRDKSVHFGDIVLELPIYFPSVSSVKTAMPPIEYIKLLCALHSITPQFLVSAFDLERSSIEEQSKYLPLLSGVLEASTVVLMDSGNFESYWKGDGESWKQTHFYDTLKRFPCSIAFGFDDQQPPADKNEHLKFLVENWQQDQLAAGETTIIPIIHGARENLSELCAKMAIETGVAMVAVPERLLGEGIFERAITVKTIRKRLEDVGKYVALHLLGTGNPISIATYSLAGADSFDGLEWCQTVVDHESGLLYHFSQADLFRGQTDWGEEELSPQARTLAHNLEFYLNWMIRLRRAMYDGDGKAFCKLNFPPRVFHELEKNLG